MATEAVERKVKRLGMAMLQPATALEALEGVLLRYLPGATLSLGLLPQLPPAVVPVVPFNWPQFLAREKLLHGDGHAALFEEFSTLGVPQQQQQQRQPAVSGGRVEPRQRRRARAPLRPLGAAASGTGGSPPVASSQQVRLQVLQAVAEVLGIRADDVDTSAPLMDSGMTSAGYSSSNL